MSINEDETAGVNTYDVIVVGSGGGLVGAYLAASRGLRTLVIEKTGKVGGTTAYSGAGLWYPGSAPMERAGITNSLEEGRTYLRTAVNDPAREARQDAYLQAGIDVIDELERNEWFGKFEFMPVPDYYSSIPGASPRGRTIFPAPVTVEELGEEAELIRKPLFTERWGIDEGSLLTGGRALIGRALKAFLATGFGEVRPNTALESLITDQDGRVVGVVALAEGERVSIHAKRGVILAAGGFERDAALRAEHQSPDITGEWSNGAPQNTGDALKAGIAIGAGTELMDEAWFVPGVVRPDGLPIFHTGTRGGIWVNAAGERFVNETAPYDQSGHAIYHGHTQTDVSHLEVRWVFDQHHLDRFSIGGSPDEAPRDEWFESGALVKADSIKELAELINVPAAALQASIDRYNGYAQSGVDEQFHRGESAWDQFSSQIVGFPAGPVMAYIVPPEKGLANPLLPPIGAGPYYAATVRLSDIGTKGGLTTDEHARVLRVDGEPIEGLYATGNTMAAMSGHVYPGAGTPIGSSIAFSYQAVLDLAPAVIPAT
jgi:3-oxosteroid 1-dehydrogenase